MQVGQAEGVEITVRGAMMSPASTKMGADKRGVSARRWDIMGIMHNADKRVKCQITTGGAEESFSKEDRS